MMSLIPGHSNYIVSDEGDIYRRNGRELTKLALDLSAGQARVQMDGEKFYVAGIVMSLFNPTDDPRLKIFHIDGDPTNNSVDNLVWMTPSEIQLYSTYTIEYRLETLSRARD